MPRTSAIVRLLDGLIELGWLFLIVAMPTFFNVRDNRAFEPDKIVLMRDVALVMAVLFLARWLYAAPYHLGRRGVERPVGASAGERGLQGLLRRWPIPCIALVFAVIYAAATANSILPRISFWGSYDRMQGLYTYLTYFALAGMLAVQLRTWNQVERLVSAVILASIPSAAYSWVQHFQQDPLSWGSTGTDLRTPSTMGNPIFMAAFLLMTVPFTLYRLVLGLGRILESERRPASAGRRAAASDRGPLWEVLGTVGYGVALILQMTAIGFSGSRGPALGFLAAVLVFALCVGVRQRIAWLMRVTAVAGVALLLVLAVSNTALRGGGNTPQGGMGRFLHLLPSESDTSEVRSLLWKSAPSLAAKRPLLGCGPEVLIFCWNPEYPAALHKIEQSNAAPDRSHDEEIDVLLMSGLLGLAAYLALIGTCVAVLLGLVRNARSFPAALFASALLAAFVGHIVEGVTGIAFSCSLLLLWLVAGVGAALRGARWGDAAALYAPAARETPSIEESIAAAGPASDALERAPRTNATRGPAPRKGRQAPPPRGPQPRRDVRGASYQFGRAWSRLPGAMQALVGAGAVALVAVAIGGAVLFYTNIQLITADVNFRAGSSYESAGNQYTTQGATASQFQQGYQYYQTSIDNYQQALDSQPTQDTYFLFLGKTMLEYADALNRDPSHSVSRQMVVAQIQQALDVFQRAARNNPYNPDHPRNIAKLYEFWGLKAFGRADRPKLVLADSYFARAAALAPHNPDILDEWGGLDVELGNHFPAEDRHWYGEARRHLEAGLGLYDGAANIYRDLGGVYTVYGQWAEGAKDKAGAHAYYLKAVDAWQKALGGPPVTRAADQYQTIYPELAQLYIQKLNDLCSAGQYAIYATKAIQVGTLTVSSQQNQRALQQTAAAAQADKQCRLTP